MIISWVYGLGGGECDLALAASTSASSVKPILTSRGLARARAAAERRAIPAQCEYSARRLLAI
jgi:hypothetical protein